MLKIIYVIYDSILIVVNTGSVLTSNLLWNNILHNNFNYNCLVTFNIKTVENIILGFNYKTFIVHFFSVTSKLARYIYRNCGLSERKPSLWCQTQALPSLPRIQIEFILFALLSLEFEKGSQHQNVFFVNLLINYQIAGYWLVFG